MNHRIFLLFVVIVFGGLFWVYQISSSINRAEGEVLARFQQVVSIYADMRLKYIEPLLNIPDVPEADRSDLIAIRDHLQSIDETVLPDDQYESLITLQKEMTVFFQNTSLSERLTADSYFIEWRKECSNLGEVRSLLFAYNTALAFYNGALKSPVGRLKSLQKHWDHPEFIGVDGTTERETKIIF